MFPLASNSRKLGRSIKALLDTSMLPCASDRHLHCQHGLHFTLRANPADCRQRRFTSPRVRLAAKPEMK